MTRVAIYARHSSDKQTHSTKDQIERCKKYCADKQYEVVQIFKDEAVSGAIPIHNRNGIHTLIEMAMLDQFSHIICEDLSRLSRDQGDIAHFYKRMLFLDILIETASEGIINELHIGLKGTMNALYLKDLGDKARRGMVASVLKGGVPGGKTYGYDIVTKVEEGAFVKGLRKINNEQADVVRNIFSWYLEGHSLLQICKTLNAQAIPSPTGKKWIPTALIGTQSRQTGLLRQTQYKGLITFNKMTYKKNPATGKRVSIMRPEKDWIRVPAPELAIIDEKMFDKVQKEVANRAQAKKETKILNENKTAEEIRKRDNGYMRTWRSRHRKTNRQKQYITSRRLWCTHCNEKIVCYTQQRERCKNPDCKHHRIVKRPELLELVHAKLLKFGEADLLPFNDQPHEEMAKKVGKLEDKLANKRQQIHNLLANLSQSTHGPETVQFLEKLETECVLLKSKLEKAKEEQIQMIPLSQDEMKGTANRFQQFINTYIQQNENQVIAKEMQQFVIRISLNRSEIESITYDLGKILSTFR